jgi:hypothetical protein
VKDSVYLCIVDVKAWKAYYEKPDPRRPIKSAIGAYVDARMEIELAMMSSFSDTEVAFEFYVRKEFVRTKLQGIDIKVHMTGNKEMSNWNWHKAVNLWNESDSKWSLDEYSSPIVPTGYSSPPQLFQTSNNVCEENWTFDDMSYAIPPAIEWQHSITNNVINTPISTPTMATPTPSMENLLEINDSLSSDKFNLCNPMKAMEVKNRKKRATKRTRLEMEEYNMEMESGVNIGDNVEMGPEFSTMDLSLEPFDDFIQFNSLDEWFYPMERLQKQLSGEWCPGVSDPLYKRLRKA